MINIKHKNDHFGLQNISPKQGVNEFLDHRIIGKSQVMQKVLEIVKRWAPTDEHVIIHGESGTGKELIARTVHDASRRAKKPFVVVNCGRFNSNTAESELFGHKLGAFTGAIKQRVGLFELAHAGTLFMDEISEMPLDVQVKLLRVLESKTFRPMGGNYDVNVDVRMVFASNKNLQECVNRGEFREDLLHRIKILPINLPPLRERPDDILPLAWHFIRTDCERSHENWEITEEAMVSLLAYSWPGNIRELRNTIRRACIFASEPLITSDLLSLSSPETPPSFPANGSQKTQSLALWNIERAHIEKVLELVEGNKVMAANVLEIDRKTLYAKLAKYGIDGKRYIAKRGLQCTGHASHDASPFVVDEPSASEGITAFDPQSTLH